MGGFLKGTNITIIHPLFQTKDAKDWTPEKITRWITQAHGQTSSKFLEGETTHIVCSETAWRNKPIIIQAALAANEKAENSGSGRKPVKIVSPDWLQDALFGKHKPSSDGAYSWLKLAKLQKAEEARVEKIVERAEREMEKGSAGKAGGGGAQQSMMAEVLQDATDPYLGEDDRAELERQAQMERKEEMRRKVQEGIARQKEKEQAAVARKAAKKARNAVFSDDYHVYMDATGFKFDVCITKVDTKHNRNERYALTLKIYESNIVPHNYAVNAHFAGTGRLPSNNVLLAKGSNFGTAMRIFKKLFKEKTQVEWDHRIAFAVERAKRDRARREGDPMAEGSGRSVPLVPGDGSAFVASFRALEEEDFAKRPFTYHPPLYGPRGVLPAKEKEVFPEIGPPVEEQARRKGAEDIELWMSGAETFGPGPSDDQADGASGDFISGGSDWNAGFDHLMSGALDAAGGINGDGEVAPGDSGDSLTDIFNNPETGYPFASGQGDDDNGDFDFNLEEPVARLSDGDTAAAPTQDLTDPPSTLPTTTEKDTNTAPPSMEPMTQPPSTAAETETQSFDHTQAALAAQEQLTKLPNIPQDPSAAAQQSAPINFGTSILGKRKISSESEEDAPSTDVPPGKKQQQQETISTDGEAGSEAEDKMKDPDPAAPAAESKEEVDMEGDARVASDEQAGREM